MLGKILGVALSFAAFVLPDLSHATLSEDFHNVQQKLNERLLDIYSGETPTNLAEQLAPAWAALKRHARQDASSSAQRMLAEPLPSHVSVAGQIGVARARLEHAAALAMLHCQKSGNFEPGICNSPTSATGGRGGLVALILLGF